MLNLVAGAGLLKVAGTFGRELLKTWLKSAGTGGLQVLQSVQQNVGRGWWFPVYNVFKMVGGGFSKRGFGREIRELGSLISGQRRMNIELQSLTAKALREFDVFAQGLFMGAESSVHQATAKKVYMSMIKTLKSNPKALLKNQIQDLWIDALSSSNIPGVGTRLASTVSLREGMLSELEKLSELGEKISRGQTLFGTRLVSNMAVVGFPTLTSNVVAYTIGKAMWKSAHRQIRGFEE